MAAVIFGFRPVDGKYFVRILPRAAKVHTVGVPHKILKQFVRILLLDNEASSLDDVAAVLNELTPLWRKLVLIYGGAVEEVFQGRVYLLVGRITPLAESLYNAIESELRRPSISERKG